MISQERRNGMRAFWAPRSPDVIELLDALEAAEARATAAEQQVNAAQVLVPHLRADRDALQAQKDAALARSSHAEDCACAQPDDDYGLCDCWRAALTAPPKAEPETVQQHDYADAVLRTMDGPETGEQP